MSVKFGQRNNARGEALFLSIVSVDSYSGLVCVTLDNERHNVYEECGLKSNAILTEIGLLEQFGKKLSIIAKSGNMNTISLMDERQSLW